jgi:single-stranded DNA-binding protein
MTILKKLVVAGRKYQDKSGKEKTVWKTVGHLHQTNDGTRKYITIDPSVNFAAFTPKEGDDRIYVNLFEPEDSQGGTAPEPAQRSAAPKSAAAAGGSGFDDMDSDIPF